MALDKKTEMIEDLLDEGLRQYGTVAVRPGLENRVLANLRSEERRIAGELWWRWSRRAGALAAVAGLALLIVWRPSAKPPGAHVVTKSEAASPMVLPYDTAKTLRPQKRSKRSHKEIVQQAVIAQQVERFPSPRRLTPEEKLLLAYVHETQIEDVLATARRSRGAEELHVQELEVSPLNVDQPITFSGQE